jgi:hypothetical protein
MKINLTDKKNPQEFIIGIVLITLMIIIAAAVLIKQAKYDLSSYGVAPASGGEKNSVPDGTAEGGIKFEKLIPDGFALLLKSETYGRDNLHEKINGKATMYLESGFVQMTSQRFASSADKNIWLELFIYDMGAYKNAFSVYSQQRRADAVEVPELGKAYSTPNSLYIVLGKYYVEISGSSKSDLLNAAIPDLGRKISAHLKTSGAENSEDVNLFDKKYVVAGSEKQYLKGAFGYSGFSDISAVQYKTGGATAIVFTGTASDNSEAGKISDGYLNFLVENGGELKKKDDSTGLKIVNLYGYFEAVTSCGKYIAGIHEAESLADAEKISEVFIKKVCGKKK